MRRRRPRRMAYEPASDIRLSEVLIEMVQIGGSMKVSAIDPLTNTEVSVIGSTRVNKSDIERLAIRKLEYVLRKKQTNGRGRSV